MPLLTTSSLRETPVKSWQWGETKQIMKKLLLFIRDAVIFEIYFSKTEFDAIFGWVKICVDVNFHKAQLLVTLKYVNFHQAQSLVIFF